MCGVVVADQEYPVRVAYTLIAKVMADFEKASKGNWSSISEDQELQPAFMLADLEKFQNPQVNRRVSPAKRSRTSAGFAGLRRRGDLLRHQWCLAGA